MVRVKNPIITRIARSEMLFVLDGKLQVSGYFGWCLILLWKWVVLPKLLVKAHKLVYCHRGTSFAVCFARNARCIPLTIETLFNMCHYPVSTSFLFEQVPRETAEQNKNYFMFRIFCLIFYYLLPKVIYCSEIREWNLLYLYQGRISCLRKSLFTPIRLNVLDLVQKYWHKGMPLIFSDHVQLLFDLCQESA